jgi:hypothetical protein
LPFNQLESAITKQICDCEERLVNETQRVSSKNLEAYKFCANEQSARHSAELERIAQSVTQQVVDLLVNMKNYNNQLAEQLVKNTDSR